MSSSASSGGWVAAHEGYSLTVTPVSRISQRTPRSATAKSSDGLLAVHGRQISLRSIDRVRARGEPALRQPRRHHAVARGHARMQRLDHAADVLLQSARRRGSDSQRVLRGVRVEAEHARRSGGRTERADRRRAVPAALMVVPRVHHVSQPAFELEPDDVGVEQRSRAARGRSSPTASTAGTSAQLGCASETKHMSS